MRITGSKPRPTSDDVNAERDRRIGAGFVFQGHPVDSGQDARENIAGAAMAAQDAKLLGAVPGDLAWQRLLAPDTGTEVFLWIMADNTRVTLDADQMIAMGYAAMMHKQGLIFAARQIKDRLAAGERIMDVTSGDLWP
ncbi:DUF4376 domain-containing protein [Mangrovibrevibacter kandeliae]|uniref:DUF4376 domain-containing protein n=1 Tax=Mangrovibrevibacter kandeliae TaxID=2968473 RepID=UPI002117D325|nr:DUF4376 domain-containing protein [Aurantimonas sp. CSK15Z-1]MCQ8781735.1 DUF4376 domain-containing protein [Aurantimonas sp. CSK15Z-1]